MIPTTPNGTRTWRSSSPFGSVYPRTTSPTGSDSPARSSSPSQSGQTIAGSRSAALASPTRRLRRQIAMACRFGGSEDDEVVAVDHLALVLGAELAGELVGRAALQGGDLGSVVVHQAAGDDRAVRRHEVDGVAGGEGALDAADAGREE